MPDYSSIPLSYKPSQIADPVETYSRLLSLKGMQASQQAQAQNAPLVYQQNVSAAQVAASQAAQAQRYEKNQQIWQDNYKKSGGDMDQTEKGAIADGATPGSVLEFRNNRSLEVANRAKATTAQTVVDDDNNDKLLGRLDLFRKKSPEDQTAQSDDFMAQANKDGILTDPHYALYQQQHPKGQPPSQSQWDDYQAGLKSHTQLQAEARLKVQQDAADALARRQAAVADSTIARNNITIGEKQNQDLIRKMTGSQTLDQWNQNLLDSGQAMDAFGPPPFRPDGTVDPQGMTRINRLGMTPHEIATSDQSAATAKEREAVDARIAAHQKVMEKQGQARINQGQDRLDNPRETTTQYKDRMTGLAHGGLVMGPDGKITFQKPNSGTQAPAPVAGKPAAKPAGSVIVKAGDGTIHSFPDDASAKKFEALVKNAGGITSR